MIVGPFQFDSPIWLALAPPLWALSWLIARRSLTGLGTFTRRAALTARFLVIGLLCAALAEPRWRTVSKDVAVNVVLDVSKSMPPKAADNFKAYVERATEDARPDDRLGLVTAAEEAFVQALPSRLTRIDEKLLINTTGGQEGTDLAAGVRLAMAVQPEDAASRILLVTDGNETAGSLLAAAQSAKAAGVPIDVLPVDYAIDREVVMERLIAPTIARRGEPVNVRMVIRSTKATRARVSLFSNDEPLDIDPAAPGDSIVVDLVPGPNVKTVPITLPGSGPQRFRANIEPLEEGGDTIAENNVATAVTFVGGEGRALMYGDDLSAAAALLEALAAANIEVDVKPTAEAHQSIVDLSAYDAVILDDVSAYTLSKRQQDELRAYVHDLGGGLVVVGGPNSFGAGGWIGSPLADALPVKLDPPQKRHMPKGALVLVMHSCEIPNGNYWGAQTATAAVDALSRLDLVGVIEYAWNAGGSSWTFPISEAGDKTAVKRAINALTFGDMPDFEAILTNAHASLVQQSAGQKHCIIISDGDPAGPSAALLQKFVAAKISISTVAVMPHGGRGSNDLSKMQWIATTTGGKSYQILGQAQLETLPQIFIKEAQTVKRSLIWEGDPFTPKLAGAMSEPLRGIAGLPRLRGYVVTAEREGLALTTLKSNEEDPILAQWQYGLGRTIAFTSDAAARWSPEWVAWPQFQAFWEQHLRWAMRPSGNANVNVITETRGDETIVVVEATDAGGDPLNFARFVGRVVLPDLSGDAIELRQTGAGRYEGRFNSKAAGSYVLNLNYTAAKLGPEGVASGVDRGSVQAAVTRPFADERRALSDNTPLLRQVAQITGGRVLDKNELDPDLFSRQGLKMPVATRSIWLAVACLAITLFLLDVGVRRVRVDLPAMARAVRRAFSRQRKAAASQVEAMKTAREKARGLMTERGAGQAVDQSPRPAQPTITKRADAGVKFEAPADLLKGRPRSPLDDVSPREGAGAQRPAARDSKPGAKPAEKEEEQGLSRLMKAKRRARESMKEDDTPTVEE